MWVDISARHESTFAKRHLMHLMWSPDFHLKMSRDFCTRHESTYAGQLWRRLIHVWSQNGNALAAKLARLIETSERQLRSASHDTSEFLIRRLDEYGRTLSTFISRFVQTYGNQPAQQTTVAALTQLYHRVTFLRSYFEQRCFRDCDDEKFYGKWRQCYFPYPIWDLTIKMYTLFQTLWCVANWATLNGFTPSNASWPQRSHRVGTA